MSSGTPGPLSITREFERQADACCGCRASKAGCRAGRRCGRRSPDPCVLPSASAAFFTRFRKTWISWSRLRVHRRQRRIVFLDDADVAREAVAGDHLHPLEHGVDVDRLALGRPLVGEDLHAVDQPDDAVGLVADQPRQRAVVLVGIRLQQLRRAADAGERVLDLVRQHGGEAGHRARRAAMRELPVDLLGHRARQQHERHVARPLGHRRGVDVDDPLGAEPRRADVDAVLGDRRAAARAPARSG